MLANYTGMVVVCGVGVAACLGSMVAILRRPALPPVEMTGDPMLESAEAPLP